MAANGEKVPAPRNAGLCGTCQHARPMESDRGSVFLMCKLSLEDARFAKYPRLPVVVCSGYKANQPET